MRNNLLSSVVTLSLFYWIVAFLVFNLKGPEHVLGMLANLPSWMQPDVPHLSPHYEKKWYDAFRAGDMQWALIKAWSYPVLLAWGAALFMGSFLAVCLSKMKVLQRKYRLRSKHQYRGMSVTMGVVAEPERLPQKPVNLKLKGIKLSKAEKAVLRDVLGILNAHPKAYVGPAHGEKTLYQHTLGVVNKVLQQKNVTPSMVIAAAAHDMGKITSYRQNKSKQWVRFRWHAQESARILSTLPSWQALDLEQREMIRLAVKYEHAPYRVPGVRMSIPKGAGVDAVAFAEKRLEHAHPLFDKPAFRDGVLEILQALQKADGAQTKEEKEKVLEKVNDLPSACLDAFLQAMPNFSFYEQGVPQGYKANAWKKTTRIYLSTRNIAQLVTERFLDESLSLALSEGPQSNQVLTPFVVNLLQALDKKGWLLKEANCKTSLENGHYYGVQRVDDDYPLWDVHSGKKILKDIMVLEISDPMVLARLPSRDAPFIMCCHVPGRKKVEELDWPKGGEDGQGKKATVKRSGRRVKSQKPDLLGKAAKAAEKPQSRDDGRAEQMHSAPVRETSETPFPEQKAKPATGKREGNKNKNRGGKTGSDKASPSKAPPRPADEDKPIPMPKADVALVNQNAGSDDFEGGFEDELFDG